MEWLEEFLKSYPGTVLIISHDRYFLDAVVTSVYHVDGGEAEYYIGNYSAFVTEREERLLCQFAAYQEQQKQIKKMKETIKRLKEWANRANPPNDGGNPAMTPEKVRFMTVPAMLQGAALFLLRA